MAQATRRRVLRSSSAVALGAVLSGCTLLSKPDLRVYNATSSSTTYFIEVANQSAGKTTVSRSNTIPSGETMIYRECFKQLNVPYLITIEIENGPSARKEWSQPNESTALGITIDSGGFTFGEVHQD